MAYIKYAAIAIVISLVLGLYGWGHHLSGKVDELTKANGALSTQIQIAHDANDSNVKTIDTLTQANQKWASDHNKDEQKIEVLSARAADLTRDLAAQRIELSKQQAEDSQHDTQNVLKIDLNSALPDLTQRLRNEQQALYQDGDQGGGSSNGDSHPEGQVQPLPAKAETP